MSIGEFLKVSISNRGGAGSRPLLESAVNPFEPFQSVQQLQASLAHMVRPGTELLGMFDGTSDPVDSNSGLIRHLELNRGGSRLHFFFDGLENLVHEFRTHILPQVQSFASGAVPRTP